MKTSKQKCIIIYGQTATGKSDFAVRLAKKINGEIISADSRQVYKGLDAGSGKITKKEMGGVPHHLLSVADPKKQYTVSQFEKDAKKAIKKIFAHGSIPIICGGTGFYISTLLGDQSLPDVPPNKKLRKVLEKKSTLTLFKELQKKDSARARVIDPHNKVRLIRALEIVAVLGKVPPHEKKDPPYNVFKIGLTLPDSTLKKKIRNRLLKRERRMITEAKKLHTQGLSWRRMEELGLEYRYLARLLQMKISKKEFREQLEKEIWYYAKRQKTWLARDKEISWFSPKEITSVEKEVRTFLRELRESNP